MVPPTVKNNVTTSSTKLTKEQLEEFHVNGFLLVPAIFSDEETAHMRQEADFILELLINSSLANHRQSHRLDLRRRADGGILVRKAQPINDLSAYLTDISNDPRLLDPMRQIMGEEPILMEEKLNYKQPLPDELPWLDVKSLDDHFPVHNDWAYYRAQDYPQDILSSAITFDACTHESGPLRVWRGSHKSFLEHDKVEYGLEVLPGLIDYDGGEEVLAPPGSLMLFHALLVHNSVSNTSGKPRRLMIYSHYPGRIKMVGDARNGGARLHESPFEWAYQRQKNAGTFTDAFTAPPYAKEPQTAP